MVDGFDQLSPIYGGGGFGKGPFVGQEALRTPFVDLFIDNERIPLLDATKSKEVPEDSSNQQTIGTNVLLLQNFNYKVQSKLGAANDVSFDILDPNYDYLTSILARRDQLDRRFSFQFGWRGINDRVNARRIRCRLLNYSITESCGFQGSKINLRGIDELSQLWTGTLTGEFPADATISEAITAVISATSSDYIPEVERIDIPLGEEFRRIEAGTTPLKYIETLLMVANSTRGSAEFVKSIEPGRDGKTIVKIRAKVPDKEISRKYILHREKEGRLISLNVNVPGLQLMGNAGGMVSGTAIDPRSKRVISVTSTQREDHREGDRRINNIPDIPTAIYQVPWSQTGLLQGFTKGMRERADSIQYDAQAELYGDAGIVPLMHIMIVVLKSQVPGQVSSISDKSVVSTSGIYRVHSVDHTITAGVFRTHLDLWKNAGLHGASTDGRPVLLDARVLDETSVNIGDNLFLTPEAIA